MESNESVFERSWFPQQSSQQNYSIDTLKQKQSMSMEESLAFEEYLNIIEMQDIKFEK